MSYGLNMQESWCDMHDDFLGVSMEKQKLENSSIIDSLGIGTKLGLISKKSLSEVSDTESEKKNSQLNNQQLSIGEILSLDLTKETICEIDILKHQIYVAGQLKKYITSCLENSNKFDIELHISKLEWLAKSSLFLSKKRSQRDIRFKKKQDHIQRNSYEFCEFGSKCFNRESKCNKKHFVYNYVYCDICELIRYLSTELNKNTKEIFTSINTINYVLNHMFDEISNM